MQPENRGGNDPLVYPEFAWHQPRLVKRFSLHNKAIPHLAWARARLDYRPTC